MDPISLLIGMGAGAVGSLFMWLFVGRKIVLKYAGEAVINSINNPDDNVKTALHNLMAQVWEWFLTPSITTGKTIKDEEGREKPEIISPFENLASEIGRIAQLRIAGMLGVDKKQKKVMSEAIQRDILNNPELANELQHMLPTAFEIAMKKGDYAPLLIQMIAPALQKFINKKGDTTTTNNW